ncbi:MAG: hypothetical protein RIB60_03760 [Phycisphaerales bacterium]
MAKKKSKKHAGMDPEVRRRIIIASVGVLGGLALTAGGWVGLDRLDAHAAEIATPPSVEVSFSWPALDGAAVGDDSATWMPASERDRLRAIALNAARGGGVLDPAALREVCSALDATGWYAAPPKVRRRGDGTIHIAGVWRLPAAVVRSGDRERLVSWEGIALPLEYRAGASGVHVLTNPSRPAPALSGEAWQGDDVAAGLALLDLLNDHDDIMAQVVGVDLGAGRRLSIITDEDTRIVWGAAPGVFRPGEQPTDIKLTRLQGMLEGTGRIDGGMGIVEIFGPNVLVVRRER